MRGQNRWFHFIAVILVGLAGAGQLWAGAAQADGREFGDALKRMIAATTDEFKALRGDVKVKGDAEHRPVWVSTLKLPGALTGEIHGRDPKYPSLGFYLESVMAIDADVENAKKVYDDTLKLARETLQGWRTRESKRETDGKLTSLSTSLRPDPQLPDSRFDYVSVRMGGRRDRYTVRVTTYGREKQ